MPGAELVDGVRFDPHGDVTVITLDRPEASNALTLAGWRRITTLFQRASRDPRLSCVVLRGAGDHAFCAGADIAEFVTERTTAAGAQRYSRAIADALEAVMSLERPVIAAIRGFAVGGGCELAAACDIRIVAEDARLGIPIGRLGVTLGHRETLVLKRLIGPARLKELLFSGRLVSASEALRIGLVDRVVPATELDATIEQISTTIRRSSRATIRAAKVVTDMCDRELTPVDTDLLLELTIDAYEGPELREGIAAFLEKRQPCFEAIRDERPGHAGA